MRFRILIAGLLLLLIGVSIAQATTAPEDSSDYALPPVDVFGPRVPLADIVRSARERERQRAEGTPGVSFSRFRKMLLTYGGDPPRRYDVIEQVQHVKVVAPQKVEVVTLRERRYGTRPDSAGVEKEKIDIGVGLEEFTTNILGVTLSLDNVDLFDYTLLDRRLLGDYLVYHIGFRPKSSFEPLPSGEVWIETGDLVVLHENAWLRDVVPLPLVIRAVDLVSRERERIEGRWVWTRQLVRVTTRLGALGGPARFELCDTHGGYQFPAAEAGGAWLVGGRRGAAELEALRQAIAESSAAGFTASLERADLALADSLGRELESVGFASLRKKRGAPRQETGVAPLTGGWGMNRVDGPRPGLAFMALRGNLGLGLLGAYSTSTRRGQGEAFLRLSRSPIENMGSSASLTVSDRTRTMLTNDFPGTGIVMLAGFDDPSDYYRRREAALALAAPVGRSARAEVRYAVGEDLARGRAYDRHPLRDDDYRSNPAAARGNRTTLAARLTGGGRGGARYTMDGEWSDPSLGPGDFSYGRFEAAFDWKPAPVGPVAARFLVHGGVASPRTPLQRRFSLGGASTLHALSPNARAGEALLFGRTEIAAARRVLPEVRLPLLGRLRPQPALFAEWGALRDGGDPRRGAADAGVALEQYLGLFSLESLRVTAAWRVPGGAPRVGIEFRAAALR